MRALLIAHEQVTEPGPVGERLAERGYDLSLMRVVPLSEHDVPDVPVEFPDPDGWDLIVPLGAPWSVYDTARIGRWVGNEIAMVRKACHLDVPVLGICFGAQVLAAALGGEVRPAPRPEVGWTELAGDVPEWLPPGPWFEWHSDLCVLPPGARELARTAVCVQAFESGRSLGVQFHPEITVATLCGWLRFGGDVACERLGIDVAALLDRTAAIEPAACERARRLVDGFLDQVACRP